MNTKTTSPIFWLCIYMCIMFNKSNCTGNDATVMKNCINDLNWTPTCIILLYLMELYFWGIHLIVKKYLKFRKE
jgi:hypothetical protein